MKDIYIKENLEKTVSKSRSIKEVSENLGMCVTGGNFYTVKKYISLHNIDTSHFIKIEDRLRDLHNFIRIPNEKIFVENSEYRSSTALKRRVLKDNLLTYECVICGNKGDWAGKPITLQLDHINGINDDNRIKNLRFLCPNCHSQTDTFCGKHKGKKFLKSQERLLNSGKTEKELENYKNRRKVERPSKEGLKDMITKLGFIGTGKVFSVSDNTIRKWCKTYDMPISIKDYK